MMQPNISSPTVFILLIGLVSTQNPSPCPEFFSYESRGTEENQWYGVLSLKSMEDLNGVWIHVILDHPADLLGNWFGEAISSDNLDYVIKNPKYRLKANSPLSVRFFVKYNAAATIPSVQIVRLNGKTLCSVNDENVEVTTPQLHISHLRPQNGADRPSGRPQSGPDRPNRRPQEPGFNSNQREPGNFNNNNRPPRPPPDDFNNQRPQPDRFDNNNFNGNAGNASPFQFHNNNNNNGLSTNSASGSLGNSDYFPGDYAINRPVQTRPTPTSGRNPPTTSGISACGTVATQASPLISHGQNTSKGQWPWHAALYHSQGVQLMYTCGGTLISEYHVVTAAHCVTKPQTNHVISASNLIVYLGKFNLKKFGPEVQDRDVSEIFVHPNYNYSVYFNDIAILKLDVAADVNNYVRPCCLWQEGIDIEYVLNKLGTVVGWGFDENRQLSNDLMQAQMPIVSMVKCIYSNRDFFSQFTFEKTYCAGFRNGTSVCNGDSGGGMVLPKSSTSGQRTVWQLRGIVSVGVALQGQGICDSSHYIVFTDVAKHLDWIKQSMNK